MNIDPNLVCEQVNQILLLNYKQHHTYLQIFTIFKLLKGQKVKSHFYKI